MPSGCFCCLRCSPGCCCAEFDTNAPVYAVTLRTFDDFALAEASLHRDVLQARAGLLRDYDTLVKAVEAMQDAVSRLRSHAQTEGLDVGPADRLAATVSQQEELTERLQEQQRPLAEFAVLRWPVEHKSRVRCSGRAPRTRNRRISGGAPLSKARHIAGRCQGAPGTDRPICGASAHYWAGRGSSAGTARAFPSTSRAPT